MLAWLLSTIVPALADSALKALFSFVSSELEKRNLIAQGKAQQYTADLQATVREATDATQIRDQVQSEPVSALDVDLEQLRRSSPASHR